MSNLVSDAEWVVLEVLWEKNPLSADEIVDKIPPQYEWKPNTVKTLINRLVQKEVLSFHKDGRRYMYFPQIEKRECLRRKNSSFLKNLYGNVLKNLFAAFVNDFIHSDNEINELRELLKEKEKELNENKDK